MPCQFLTHTMSETRSAGPFLCLDKCFFCPYVCVLYDSHTQATKKGQICKMLLLYPNLDSKVQGAHNGNVCCLHRLISSCGSTNHDQSEEETAHLRSNLASLAKVPVLKMVPYRLLFYIMSGQVGRISFPMFPNEFRTESADTCFLLLNDLL